MSANFTLFVLNSSPQANTLLQEINNYRSIIEAKLPRRLTVEVCTPARLNELSDKFKFGLKPAALRTPQGNLISFANVVDFIMGECARVAPRKFGELTSQQQTATAQVRGAPMGQGTPGDTPRASSFSDDRMPTGFNPHGSSSDAPNNAHSYISTYTADKRNTDSDNGPSQRTQTPDFSYGGGNDVETGKVVPRPSNSSDSATVFIPPPVPGSVENSIEHYFSFYNRGGKVGS